MMADSGKRLLTPAMLLSRIFFSPEVELPILLRLAPIV